MEQPNVESVKVETSTNDAGQHPEEDNKRDAHGGGFRGRGRGVSITCWYYSRIININKM